MRSGKLILVCEERGSAVDFKNGEKKFLRRVVTGPLLTHKK